MAGMNFRYLCLILVVFALLPWVSGENAEAAGAHQVGDVNAPFEFIETSAPSPFSSSAISTPRPLTSAPTTIVPVVCGNGNREEQESCDDSNVADGDGCSQNCTVETGCTCSAPSTGPDTCALQSTPPTGQVFVKASTRLTGITAPEFVDTVRLTFRTGVATALLAGDHRDRIEAPSRGRSAGRVPRGGGGGGGEDSGVEGGGLARGGLFPSRASSSAKASTSPSTWPLRPF